MVWSNSVDNTMKKLLVLPLLVSFLSTQAAVYEDFRKGLDATAFTTLTAARLNQMIDNGTVNTNKGLVIVTNGTPNTASFPHYTNFLWLDISTQPPVLKLYTSAGGGAWNSVGLGTTNVTTDKIADGAVTTVKIAGDAVDITKITNNAISSAKLQDGSVTRAKLSDSPPAIWPEHFNTGAVGDAALTNAQIIGTTRIVDGSVTREKLAAGVIGAGQLTNNVIYSSNLNAAIIYGSNIVANTITFTNIASNTVRTNELDQQIVTNLFLMKAFGKIVYSGGASLVASRNVSSISYAATGKFTVNFATPMTTTNYVVQFGTESTSIEYPVAMIQQGSQTVNSFIINTISTRTGGADVSSLSAVHFTVIE